MASKCACCRSTDLAAGLAAKATCLSCGAVSDLSDGSIAFIPAGSPAERQLGELYGVDAEEIAAWAKALKEADPSAHGTTYDRCAACKGKELSHAGSTAKCIRCGYRHDLHTGSEYVASA